ncbi:hypothetical protein SBD_1091 [Streptomyces bottropensis ATCC 25435]|uniref:Uncharacterized protein n=1 Tax=Streptomyces bottropensis ATCC 25435 TaxID=1054862 RepID=M3G1D7_9ACTN|nr:hypothetical protein SBD_1091 [Streptomyces bottropensis ATCC 25435]
MESWSSLTSSVRGMHGRSARPFRDAVNTHDAIVRLSWLAQAM